MKYFFFLFCLLLDDNGIITIQLSRRPGISVEGMHVIGRDDGQVYGRNFGKNKTKALLSFLTTPRYRLYDQYDLKTIK